MPAAVDVTEVNIVLAPPLICLPRRLPLTASSSYRPLCLHCPAVSFTPRPIHAHTFHSVFFLSTRPPSLANHSQSSLSSFTPLLFPVQFLNLRASLLPLCPPPTTSSFPSGPPPCVAPFPTSFLPTSPLPSITSSLTAGPTPSYPCSCSSEL